jgi:hypothetical protein
MKVHVHLDGFALRETLAAYGIEAYVRVCGVEHGCWTVSNDTREIVRDEMPALARSK